MKYKINGNVEFEAEDIAIILGSIASFAERMGKMKRGRVRSFSFEQGIRLKTPPRHKRHKAPPDPDTSTAPAGPTVVPDAEWTDTDGSVPDSGAPSLSPAQEAQLAEGADLWMGVLMQWQEGFGDPEAEQPDRLKILSEAVMQGGGPMFACLRHYGGLTLLVRSLLATTPKRRARRIAENVAQVSSAAGIPIISDHLEFTREYMGEEYKNVHFDD